MKEAGLKKTFRDQIGNHTHALLIRVFFARVGIILFFAFCPFSVAEQGEVIGKCKNFFFFFRLVFFLCCVESALVRVVRHCNFLVCHTCHPSCVPSPFICKMIFKMAKSMSNCNLTLISHSEHVCTCPVYFFSIQFHVCIAE